MRQAQLISVAALLGTASIASATISFSFADPIPGRQVTATANGGGPGIARVTYDTNMPLTFLVDATGEGFGTHLFTNARLEMSLDLQPAVSFGGVTTASVQGSWTIYDMASGSRVNILTGTTQSSSFVRLGGTNSILESTPDGFVYTAGPAMTSFLGGMTLSPLQEGVFTLTDVATSNNANFIGAGGVFQDFFANASFSGDSQLVPAPGSLALLSLSGLAMARRRR